jgi:hypothetical protein
MSNSHGSSSLKEKVKSTGFSTETKVKSGKLCKIFLIKPLNNPASINAVKTGEKKTRGFIRVFSNFCKYFTIVEKCVKK